MPVAENAISMPMEVALAAGETEAFLNRYLAQVDLPDALRAAVRYAVLSPGKRLRPALLVMCNQCVGGNIEAALPSAAAVELVHCFSLVHDDLPAMDDDDLRRGRPTLHKHADEATAILAGDVMMPLAIRLLTEHDAATVLIEELTEATTAMIAGQVYDTFGGLPEGLDATARLEMIHRNKTGALIRAACRMGAVCGGANAEQLDALTRYGEAIGLMFQIVDDLLDISQTSEHLGKRAGKDVDAGKQTFPDVLGVDQSQQTVAQLRDEAITALDAFGKQGKSLRELCQYMAVRTR